MNTFGLRVQQITQIRVDSPIRFNADIPLEGVNLNLDQRTINISSTQDSVALTVDQQINFTSEQIFANG